MEDPIALYLVVSESIDMHPGKLGAQTGHAVEKILNQFHELDITNIISHYDEYAPCLTIEQVELVCILKQWQENGSRKITLRADEKEWAKLKEEFGKDVSVVVDAGITDLEPGTETVMAFWPRHKSARSKSLKRLRAM